MVHIKVAFLLSLALACLSIDGANSDGPVVISGATGRTGSLIYNLLKSKEVPVRAFVHNATKAKALLGCSKCDESEGIYVGDITRPSTLKAPMTGAGSLVIATSAEPICDPFPNCHFRKGGEPKDVDWIGARNQLTAFATATSGQGHIVLISTMGTTSPEKSTDPFDHISFYKLNFEAELEASGVSFTIVKPCGLSTDKAGTKELIVGHDDEINVSPPLIARADVARLVAFATMSPKDSAGLRFDLCSKEGAPTKDEDLVKVLRSARYPWDSKPEMVV